MFSPFWKSECSFRYFIQYLSKRQRRVIEANETLHERLVDQRLFGDLPRDLDLVTCKINVVLLRKELIGYNLVGLSAITYGKAKFCCTDHVNGDNGRKPLSQIVADLNGVCLCIEISSVPLWEISLSSIQVNNSK